MVCAEGAHPTPWPGYGADGLRKRNRLMDAENCYRKSSPKATWSEFQSAKILMQNELQTNLWTEFILERH
jgi:hypothetical protein